MTAKPQLHVLAGPNGAGKSTLYEVQIKPRYPRTEFVNVDLLAWTHYGHPAQTQEETLMGQRLANERREWLMRERRGLITESIFSHPSKLELLQQAQEMGYDIRVYHIHLRSADISVSRVAQRVRKGGHPVPEDKIRERFARNQSLIREAVMMADRAYVFDNSVLGRPHQEVLEFQNGKAIRVDHLTPQWTQELYADALRGYSPERLNRAAASWDVAKRMMHESLGDEGQLNIPKRTVRGEPTRYYGPVIAETDLHVVQQVGTKSAVAFFKDTLVYVPNVGELTCMAWDGKRYQIAVVERNPRIKQGKHWDNMSPEERREALKIQHEQKQSARHRKNPNGRSR
jgi:predicted ABC-type ATPase